MPDSNCACFELYDHEADMGVRGMSETRAGAFEQTALALTAVVVDPACVRPEIKVEVTCSAPDDELLLVEWLNAIVYEMAVRRMLFSRFQVQFDDNGLNGRIWGEFTDIERHHPAVEVKGATLTTLAVYRNERNLWVAQTVVDV